MDESSRKAFRAAVVRSSHRSDVRDSVGALYQHLQDAIEIRGPICERSGRCCRFDEYGHRLFVTTMELATFAFASESPANPPRDSCGCPFQIDGLCSVHTIRPFGCRVFFCDPTATEWQNQQYERFHGLLKKLHEDLKVPYFYVEWRQALAMLWGDPVGAASSALTRCRQG
jgi:hypothetical protein